MGSHPWCSRSVRPAALPAAARRRALSLCLLAAVVALLATVVVASASPVVGATAARSPCWGRRPRRAVETADAAPHVPRDVLVLPDLASASHGQRWQQKNSVVLTARRRSKHVFGEEEVTVPAATDSDDDNDDGRELSLEEMRAQLGPVGKTVAAAVEVGIVTAGSYLSGGVLGYLGGGLFGVGSLLRPADTPPPPSPLGVAPPDPNLDPIRPPSRGLGGEFRGRLRNLNARAVTSAKSWAQLSAAFSGFHALTRVARGGKEDRWNSIVGSAMTGAYLNRQGGPQSMLQGATTYASFTYMLDIFFGTKGGDKPLVDDHFDFTEKQLN